MMQAAINPISSSPSLEAYLQDEVVQTEANFCDEFGAKLKFEASDVHKIEISEPPDENTIEEDEEQERLEHDIEDEDDDDNDNDSDDDFSFTCSGIDTSPVAAEDAFQDGQIRPFFPLFNQDLLLDYEFELRKNQMPPRLPVKKVFVETRDSSLPPSSSSAEASENYEIEAEAAGPYCAWTKKAVDASPDACKKSNSTGFSKLWRFRDLLNRSNSDGRDAYVFLNGSTTTTASTMSAKREDKVEKNESSSSERKAAVEAKIPSAGVKVKAKKGVKGKTASLSAHEMHYMRNRASKEEDRHKSYLPYRPGLVGFFTNVNGGMSRNVHPF